MYLTALPKYTWQVNDGSAWAEGLSSLDTKSFFYNLDHVQWQINVLGLKESLVFAYLLTYLHTYLLWVSTW
jgi:hypothetical protein